MLACYWKKTTGLDCPGCGMQRSFQDLANGDVVSSWFHFPAIFLFIALIIYSCLHLIKPHVFPAKYSVVLMILTVALMLGNWIWKMF